ncbi:MAG: MotA/TolQ/ExbB proton channel family protein [Myxococcota bacterium]
MTRAIAFGFVFASVIASWLAGPAWAGPAATAPPERSLFDWYAMGGPPMHGLAVCSILILATILERAWMLRPAATIPRALLGEMERALAVGNRSELKRLAEGGSSALVRLASQALDPDATLDAIETAGAWEAHRIARNLPLLSALGHLATMIGLLGTVLGMLDAFDRIALVGTGDARVVAGGIFLALITTAAGLFAAILAVAAHALLSRRAEDAVAALERMTGAIRDSADPARGVGRFDFTTRRERGE